MTLYAYTPQRGDSGTKVLAFALLFGGLIIIMLGAKLPEYRGAVQMAGFMLDIAFVMICARFLLTSYTYSVESPDGDGIADLVIIETRSGRDRTVCRVTVTDGMLTESGKGKLKPLGKRYDYRTGLFTGSYYFTAIDADGESVRFCPDEKLIELMKMMGAKCGG